MLLLRNRLNVLNLEGFLARLHALQQFAVLHPLDVVFDLWQVEDLLD